MPESPRTVRVSVPIYGHGDRPVASIETDVTVDYRRQPPEPEYVILNRSALFEFLGEFALPPWLGARGETLGSDVPCGPIAEALSKWVRTHDLAAIYDLAPADLDVSPR